MIINICSGNNKYSLGHMLDFLCSCVYILNCFDLHLLFWLNIAVQIIDLAGNLRSLSDSINT